MDTRLISGQRRWRCYFIIEIIYQVFNRIHYTPRQHRLIVYVTKAVETAIQHG